MLPYSKYRALGHRILTAGLILFLSVTIAFFTFFIHPSVLSEIELLQLQVQLDEPISNPTVYSLDSHTVKVGEEIVFHGENFGNTPGRISIGSEITLPILEENWSETKIQVTVPPSIVTFGSHIVTLHASKKPMNSELFFLPKARWQTNQRIQILPNTFEYTVQTGDSLFKIAKDQLGAEGRYLEILRLNEEQLQELNKIEVGLTLLIPNE